MRMKIITLEDHSKTLYDLLRNHWPRHYLDFRVPEGFAPDRSIKVEVNHGRWIVKCQFCRGAQLASRRDHRFFCVDCLHQADPLAFLKWIKVEWPSKIDVERIERALGFRLHEEQRNWIVNRADGEWEPVEVLLGENVAHNVIEPLDERDKGIMFIHDQPGDEQVRPGVPL